MRTWIATLGLCVLCLTVVSRAQDATTPAPSPSATPDPVALMDGGRIVLFGGKQLAPMESAWIDALGDRIRLLRPAIRVEIFGAASSSDPLARMEGDVLGRKPTHVVLVPDPAWQPETVTKLVNEFGKEPDVIVLFWPEGTEPPTVTTIGPLQVLPASLLQGKGEAAIEALIRLLRLESR